MVDQNQHGRKGSQEQSARNKEASHEGSANFRVTEQANEPAVVNAKTGATATICMLNRQ